MHFGAKDTLTIYIKQFGVTMCMYYYFLVADPKF